MSDKPYFFLAIPDETNKTIDWFPMLADGTAGLSATVNNYAQFQRVATSYPLVMTKELTEYLRLRKAEYPNPKEMPSDNVLYCEFVSKYLLTVTGGSRYLLNCTTKTPMAQVVKDIRTGQYIIERSNDITYQYQRRSEASETIRDFYAQLENGDYLLYYLNEYRKIRAIPILTMAGEGGSGKSTIINHFASYKPTICKTLFRGEFTGEFGTTSLIVQDDTEERTAPELTLNRLKDFQTSNIHPVRRMRENPTTARGFVTILLACNNNNKSIIMQILNAKGEDVESIKRRMSTFNFTEANREWIKQDNRGEKLNQVCKLRDDNTTELDCHLNWLEDNNFFQQEKFIRKTPLYLLVHSPAIHICDRLSDDDGLLLEELYNHFQGLHVGTRYDLDFTKSTKEAYQSPNRIMADHRPIERALYQMCGSKVPGEVKIHRKVEYVCPGAFAVKRTEGVKQIVLTDISALENAYKKYKPSEVAI